MDVVLSDDVTWLSVYEAAERVGVNPQTVRAAVARLGEAIKHRRRGIGRTAPLLIHPEGVETLRGIYPPSADRRRVKNSSAMRT